MKLVFCYASLIKLCCTGQSFKYSCFNHYSLSGLVQQYIYENGGSSRISVYYPKDDDERFENFSILQYLRYANIGNNLLPVLFGLLDIRSHAYEYDDDDEAYEIEITDYLDTIPLLLDIEPSKLENILSSSHFSTALYFFAHFCSNDDFITAEDWVELGLSPKLAYRKNFGERGTEEYRRNSELQNKMQSEIILSYMCHMPNNCNQYKRQAHLPTFINETVILRPERLYFFIAITRQCMYEITFNYIELDNVLQNEIKYYENTLRKLKFDVQGEKYCIADTKLSCLENSSGTQRTISILSLIHI